MLSTGSGPRSPLGHQRTRKPQADRGARRGRPARARQWHASRQAARVGWARTRPCRALHGRARRKPAQSSHPRLLSPLGRSRQAEETRPHGLYEEAPHDSQRDDADRHDLAEDSSIRVRLTFKTVAIRPPRSGNENAARDVSVALPEGHLAGEEGIVRRRLYVAVGVEGP
jgi:hypothetical protein